MKKPIIAILVLTGLCLGFASSLANAHVLKTDGEIGAILHINPDDNPISGSPTSYILAFSDTSSRFKINYCICNIKIIESGRTIATQQLADTYPQDSEDTFTFPKPDVYSLIVKGQPKVAGEFQPFTITYIVRVEAGVGSVNSQSFPVLLSIGLGLTSGLIVLAAYKLKYDYNIRHKAKRGKHV